MAAHLVYKALQAGFPTAILIGTDISHIQMILQLIGSEWRMQIPELKGYTVNNSGRLPSWVLK